METVAPRRSSGELAARNGVLVGSLTPRAELFPPKIWTVVQIGAAAEILLRLHSFVVTTMARAGFLSRDVPLAFAFICLFIYFDNPHFRDRLCSRGISGLSRQFLTLFTQGICWVVFF